MVIEVTIFDPLERFKVEHDLRMILAIAQYIFWLRKGSLCFLNDQIFPLCLVVVTSVSQKKGKNERKCLLAHLFSREMIFCFFVYKDSSSYVEEGM